MRQALSRTLDRLQESFPRVCGLMNWSPVGMGPFHDLVRRELSPQKGERVLDFGCGRGAFTALFDDCGYLGIDVSPALVAYARRSHPAYRYAVMDGACLAIRDSQFDAVAIVGVLHHLDDGLVRGSLQELRRILRPAGRIMVVEPVPVVSPWNVPGRLIKSLDLGHFIRRYDAWQGLVSSEFELDRSCRRRIGFNDLAVLVGRS
jgi:SAM-dependent methyltransferase